MRAEVVYALDYALPILTGITVAGVDHFDCLAYWRMRKEIHDLVGFLNRVTIEAGHDIATDQSGVVRRPAGRLDIFKCGAAVSRVEIIHADVRSIQGYAGE